jgi:hypothetical protein
MAWRKVQIVNCKSASVRQTPWIPLHDKEIVGIRDGPELKNNDTIKQGDTIDIDPDQFVYSWVDRKYYKTRDPDVWIYEGVVDFGGNQNG